MRIRRGRRRCWVARRVLIIRIGMSSFIGSWRVVGIWVWFVGGGGEERWRGAMKGGDESVEEQLG